MFVMTAKLSKSKLIAGGVVIIAVLLLIVMLATSGGDAPSSAPMGSTNDERVAYLATFGWSVNAEPTEVQKVKIPETEENINDSVGNDKSDSESKIKKNYITVKSKDGGEEPLLITRYMPTVRGVAVVCNAANNQKICQSITDAVTAALGITSKKVYVSAPIN